MLKRNNKAIAIVMAFAMCLTFLAPAFISAPVAQAATTYQALSVPSLASNTAGQSLGIIQIDVDNCAGLVAGDVLTVSFSSEVDLACDVALGTPVAVGNVAARTAAIREVVVPANLPGGTANGLAGTVASASITSTHTTLDITFAAPGVNATNPGRILVYLQGTAAVTGPPAVAATGVKIGSISDDVTATVMGPPGNTIFPQGSLAVAKVNDKGGTMTSVKSVKSVGSAGGSTDTIVVVETKPGSITAGDVLKFKLPVGFSWRALPAGTAMGTFTWGYSAINGGVVNYGTAAGQTAVVGADTRVMEITVPTPSTTLAGSIRFGGFIVPDDSIAKAGDVTVNVSDSKGDITGQDIVVAKYGTFNATVSEGTKPALVAGQACQKLGEFYIEEELANSLVNNRIIKLSLPKGVKWTGDYETGTVARAGFAGPPTPGSNTKLDKGNVTLAYNGFADTNSTLKWTITQPANPSTAAKIKFKELKVDVAPDFTGPIKIKVDGTAGVTGEVTVGDVKPAVEVKSEDAKNVRIGEQNQELGSITIKEAAKESALLVIDRINIFGPDAIARSTDGAITLTLPSGSEWSAGYPTVEVTEGDLQLKTNNISKVGGVLTIPIKSSSTKASTIKISGMKATINRTVPEGDFKIAVDGTAINQTGGQLTSVFTGALVNLAFPQYEATKAVVAKCVTPAPGEGTIGSAAGQFRIDSNIYEVNGVAKVMDASPYVKAGRTYVPVKYLGLALGVAEKDVVWDATAQKATLTLGDKKVELTIGSTSYTVNGEAKTMEVAPEITNGRTMLPARYVAEALGFNVGWDASTRTILVSK